MPVDVTFDDTFSGLLRYYYRKKHVKQRILTLPLSLDFGNIKTANIVRTRASFLEELSRKYAWLFCKRRDSKDSR